MKAIMLGLVLSLLGCASTPVHVDGTTEEVLVTFTMPAVSPSSHSGSQRSYRGGSRWEVDLRTRQLARQFARRYGLTLKEGWPIDALGLYCVAYELPPTLTLAALQELASDRGEVMGIQANTRFLGMGRVTPRTYDDPLFKYQFGEHNHRLVQLHQHSTGNAVAVGIIDSPVDGEHPDLQGQIRHQVSFTKTSSITELNHGTAVTGVIAAAEGNSQGVVGVAPAAEVHVFGACRSNADGAGCRAFDVLKAMQAALEKRIQVLNLSLAGPHDALLDALIDEATARGVIVIAASNLDNPLQNFPAQHDAVFAVSGDLGLWFTLPEQMTTLAGGGYQVFRGSSVSAAAFTGVAALVRSRSSEAKTRTILTTLQQGCAENSPRLFNNETCL